MYKMTERDRALLKVQQMGFMTDDLRLYLNTHPDCTEALSALKYYLKAECDLKEKYEQKYGPLTLEGISKCGSYNWPEGAWPWEMGE